MDSRRSFFKLFSFALLSLPFVGASALAGRYELIKGKGVEVCEAYQRNLNSINHPYPMMCEREINPAMKDFKKPEWKELDVRENREMVKNIELFLGNHPRGNPKDDLARWEDGVKDRVKIHHLKVELAQVDIDNDGKVDNVVKYYDGSCPMTRHYGTPLLVLGGDKSYIDIKTVPLMQNPHESIYSLSAGWEFSMYDIFLYRDKVYFDRWNQRRGQADILKVFVTETNILATGITKEVCRYQFQSGK